MRKHNRLRTATLSLFFAVQLYGFSPRMAFAQTSEEHNLLLVEEAFAPQYPKVALAAQVRGIVRVSVVVDKLGSVERAEALTGSPMLVPFALEAAKKWKFKNDRERTIEIVFEFETLPSATPKDLVGAIYKPPMDVIIRDRVPVIPDSPKFSTNNEKGR